MDFDLIINARSSVGVQWVDQRGRATFCGAVGFGFTPQQNFELVPIDEDAVPPPVDTGLLTPGYVAVFTPPDPVDDCNLDINTDGAVDFFDVLAYLKLHDACDPDADWNNDGTIEPVDLQLFLQNFEDGCEPYKIG